MGDLIVVLNTATFPGPIIAFLKDTETGKSGRTFSGVQADKMKMHKTV